ncbi:MAG: flagellar biosynthesis anti-sigma factor FlgM [Desulfobacteraceae bacterium]|nr:flagellar biosynthesis anti-sigma factor FlgM [Desulfobacteraceae bacterium]
MEITGNHPFARLDAYVKNIGKEKNRVHGSPREAPKGGLSEDKVALSPEAKQIQEAKRLLDSLPDIREDKVAEIKEQIESGAYNIDGEKIAFKMIKESILNELL